MLEVADRIALALLGTEEGDGCLGRHGRRADRLRRRDDDKPVALGLPCKVNHGVLDRVDNLDGDALLLDAEDLQRGRLRLLGLGVPVDLDAEVRRFRLPVELGVRDAEEVQRPDNLLGRDAHQGDSGGVAADFRCPEAEELFVCLDAVSARGRRGPLKVHDTLDLDRRLVQEIHLGELIDRNRGALVQPRHVLVVGGPLERGPGEFGRLLGAMPVGRRVELGERPQGFGRLDVPDDVVLAVVVKRQGRMAGVGNGDWPVRPGDQVLLVGGEGDEVHEGMGEPPQPRPRGAAPQQDTLRMHRREVGPQGRPLDEGLGPLLPVDNVLGRILLVVPEDADRIPSEHDELVPAAPARVRHEGPEVLLLLELLDLGRLELFVHAAFSPVPVDIGELVDAQGVPLVQRGIVELPHRGGGFGGRRVLDEGKPAGLRVSAVPRAENDTRGEPAGWGQEGLARPRTSATSHCRPWACRPCPHGSCRPRSASSA